MDRRELRVEPQPEGVVLFHVRHPACLVQDIDHRVVRTRWQPDLPEEAWVRDALFVFSGAWAGHRIAMAAPIDDDGVARVTIPPSVWNASPDGLSAEVRIGPYSLGRVRLVRE